MLRLLRSLQVDVLGIGRNVFHQFKMHKCSHQAASLAFTTVLSLVPLSAVTLFLLKTFGVVENEKSPLIDTLNNFLPQYRADEIVTGITEFTNRNLTGLGIGGFLLFLFISIILFMSIETHFNHIWGSRSRLPLVRAFQKYLVFCMLLLIGPIIIWFVFSTVASGLIAHLFPWVSVFCLFFLMYIALPNTTVNWKAALSAAVLAGSLFQVARIVFANYFELVWQNYTAIYGTLAMIIILAIWIYATWLVILLGVEITNAIQRYVDPGHPLGTQIIDSPNYIINATGIITLYLLLAKHFNEGKGACSTADVAVTAKVSESLVQDVFERFNNAKLIYEVEDETKRYIPARPLDTITLDMLVASVDRDLVHQHLKAVAGSPMLRRLYQELQEAETERLRDVTVRSVLEGLDK